MNEELKLLKELKFLKQQEEDIRHKRWEVEKKLGIY